MSLRILHPRADAAYRLAISLRMLDALISTNQIKTVKIGRRRFVPAGELEAFARRGTSAKQTGGRHDSSR
jgi:hypothetical protein